jgi:DnaJ-class molecular chaperone
LRIAQVGIALTAGFPILAPFMPADDERCPPCRGTGRLISTLGGSPHEVDCPWCEGSGHFRAGHDAQAAAAGGEPGVHQPSSASDNED